MQAPFLSTSSPDSFLPDSFALARVKDEPARRLTRNKQGSCEPRGTPQEQHYAIIFPHASIKLCIRANFIEILYCFCSLLANTRGL